MIDVTGLSTFPLYKTFSMLQNSNFSKFSRHLFALSFIGNIFHRKTVKNANINIIMTNKMRYLVYKDSLSKLLISTYGDAVTGWLELVIFFFTSQQYVKMHQVLQLAFNILSIDLLEVNMSSSSPMCFMKIPFEKGFCTCKSLLKRIRHEAVIWSRVGELDLKLRPYLYDSDVSLWNFGAAGLLTSPPCVAFYYLTYLYNLKTKQYMQSRLALNLLKSTVENMSNVSLSCRTTAFWIYRKACTLDPISLESHESFVNSFYHVLKGTNKEDWLECIDMLKAVRKDIVTYKNDERFLHDMYEIFKPYGVNRQTIDLVLGMICNQSENEFLTTSSCLMGNSFHN